MPPRGGNNRNESPRPQLWLEDDEETLAQWAWLESEEGQMFANLARVVFVGGFIGLLYIVLMNGGLGFLLLVGLIFFPYLCWISSLT